jgi:hypothetical protein
MLPPFSRGVSVYTSWIIPQRLYLIQLRKDIIASLQASPDFFGVRKPVYCVIDIIFATKQNINIITKL